MLFPATDGAATASALAGADEEARPPVGIGPLEWVVI